MERLQSKISKISGFEVRRFISFKNIEDSKEGYYKDLNKPSMLFQHGKSNLQIR